MKQEVELYQCTQYVFRKKLSTSMLLTKFQDDIIKAMNKIEIFIATFTDFSKAFDTIDYAVIIQKLHSMNFSKCFLYWLVDYLIDNSMFRLTVKYQKKLYVKFGVPNRSSCLRYPDDSTLYKHFQPKDIDTCFQDIQDDINKTVK